MKDGRTLKGDGRTLKGDGRIEHVVCVMLENRSFDHMLGFLKSKNSDIDGLNGNETNPLYPSDPSKGSAKVEKDAPYVWPIDPSHSVPPVTRQIFGKSEDDGVARMDGFVESYRVDAGSTAHSGADIMRCFNPESAPAINTLASEFAVFDHWFCSVPGPTDPNRLFLHSCTSWGASEDDEEQLIEGYPQKTVFDSLVDGGCDFRCYWSDFPTVLFLRNMRQLKYVDKIRVIDDFYDDCRAGTLANYTFLEPRWFDFLEWPASDEHPPHDVRYGENFLADIYEALRASPAWEKTALVITYDEHGGFYDHVPTPLSCPAPDDRRPPEGQPPFNFQRLGVRVPTVVVSPWVRKGTVCHSAPVNEYDHTSVHASLVKLFGLPGFLTKRDAWASPFNHVWSELSAPRTDCPLTVPRPGPAALVHRWRAHSRFPRDPAVIHRALTACAGNPPSPISDQQRSVLILARAVSTGLMPDADARFRAICSEQAGAEFAMQAICAFQSRGRASVPMIMASYLAAPVVAPSHKLGSAKGLVVVFLLLLGLLFVWNLLK